MSDFRTRLLGLAAIATAFAGVSYGQSFSCGYNGIAGTTGTGLGYVNNGVGYAPTQTRISATNDLVTDLVFACGKQSVSSVGALTVTLSASVTSRVGEATAILTPITSVAALPIPPFTTGGAGVAYTGTYSGNQLIFTGVTFPASAYTVEVTNVRVNDTGLAATTPITESAFITNLGLVQFSAPAIPVAYVFADFTFNAPTFGGPYAICVGSSANFTVGVTEKFGAAFKSSIPGGITVGGAPIGNTSFCGGITCDMANGNAGSWSSGAGFTSLVNAGAYVTPGIGSGVGQATHGTRFAVTFANMNAGVVITMPNTVTIANASGNLTAYMTASATGAFSAVAGGVGSTTVPLNGTVYYEIAYADDTFQTTAFLITGTYSWAANFSSTPVTAPTVAMSQAPAAAVNPVTNDVPNFVAAPSPNPLSTWILCNTTLLFPYLANGAGFDTGIVFANTSTDPLLATIGISSATPEVGTCSMWFYGTGAPTNPVLAPNGAQASGTDNAFTLSSVAPGFSGYMIAICNYQWAHGFAYITYDLTQNNGAAMGYLALVVLNPGGRAFGGLGTESLNN